MPDNKVLVTLAARDLLSPAIRGIKGDMGGLGNTTKITSGIMSSFMGNLGAMAVSSGISAMVSGFQKVTGAITDAARVQTLGLAQAGDLASQLGVNFEKAKGLVADTRIEISKMAAALPGENSDYNAIFTQISATVAKVNKGNIAQFKADTLELTKNFGVLASIRGVDANSGGSAVNRLLAGTMGIREAFSTNDITQKNPLLETFINEQLKIIGKSQDDWKNLTDKTRTSILLTASKKAVTDETIASFDGTVDSMMALAKTTLFDQDTGMFGFMKKIGSMGGRSALDGVQGLFLSLKSLGESLVPFGKSLGLSMDGPMALFISVTDWLTDVTNSFHNFLDGGNVFDFDEVIQGLVGGITGFINGAFRGIETAIDTVNWLAVGAGLSRLGNAIWRGIYSLDWAAIARVTVKTLITLPAKLLIGAIANSAYEIPGMLRGAFQGLINGIKGTFDYLLDSIMAVVEKIKGQLGLGGGSKDSQSAPENPVVQKVKQAALGVAVSAIPGAGAVINTVRAIQGIPSAPVTPLTKPETPNNTQKSTNISFNPVINSQPGQSPLDIAEATLDLLNTRFKVFKEGQLA